MTFVPYQDSRRRARRQLDRPTIVTAALALMDQVGVDGMTMRRLAQQLEVTPGSLYRHVRDKAELLVLLADEISGQVPMVAEGVAWQTALSDLARAVRRVLVSHRDAARLLASTLPGGPQRLRAIEGVLRVLVAAGFSDQDAAWAAYHFNNLVTEFVADEVRLETAAAAAGRTRRDVLAEARAQLQALPPDQFPTLIRLAESIASDDAEAVFEFGLRLCVLGMESLGRATVAAASRKGTSPTGRSERGA
ncbi:MAG: TetR family transcriptional regulator [Chloroflexi bacterium]|nr:MAG: TetR family transcriptional regulator [Chloroflexota bacterium]